MVAGILALHGVWAGRCREPDRLNRKGYYENLDFKAANIEAAGRLAQSGELAGAPPEWFSKQIRRFAPDSGPWMAKFSALYYPLWEQFNPRWIKVRRNAEEIMRSNITTGFFGTDDLGRIMELIQAHNHAMNGLPGEDVYTNELIRGDLRSIRTAIQYVGLEFDAGETLDFIDPALWRHGERHCGEAGG